jgi:hypothetical protein
MDAVVLVVEKNGLEFLGGRGPTNILTKKLNDQKRTKTRE